MDQSVERWTKLSNNIRSIINYGLIELRNGGYITQSDMKEVAELLDKRILFVKTVKKLVQENKTTVKLSGEVFKWTTQQQ